jgi:hypothetical protein
MIVAYDTQGNYINDKSYIIPIDKLWFLAYLNHIIASYIISYLSPPVRGGFFAHRVIYMEQLPIVEPSAGDQARLGELVEGLQAVGGRDDGDRTLAHGTAGGAGGGGE